MESHKRSIAKAVVWRIIAAVITALTVYLFTKEEGLAIGVGIADSAIKLFVYYAHERLWDKVSFGREKKVKEDYMI